jgi:sulfur carrier protein ThiS adenylyltransferase
MPELAIMLNGRTTAVAAKTAFELKTGPDDVLVVNGFAIAQDRPLVAGDEVFVIPRHVMPNAEELEALMAARHTPGVHRRLKEGRVAIAGLGGLGSHVAVMLARVGVGKLLLVDFDVVEPSNLNRQHYLVRHLGQHKTEAMRAQLSEINPYIDVTACDVRVTAQNACTVFAGWPVVVEAFDNPAAKAMLVSALLAAGTTKIVAASGLAGYEDANRVQTRRRMRNLFLCGDLESAAGEGCGLMAPRVMVCAGHQANLAMRLVLGYEE